MNRSKGYDLFGNAILKILNKYKDWKAIVIGDEPRMTLYFKHKRLKNLGFKIINDGPKKGADNKLICFIHPKSTNHVLIELCQEIK